MQRDGLMKVFAKPFWNIEFLITNYKIIKIYYIYLDFFSVHKKKEI